MPVSQFVHKVCRLFQRPETPCRQSARDRFRRRLEFEILEDRTMLSASAIIMGEAFGLQQGSVLGGLTTRLVGTTTGGQAVDEKTTTNAAGFYAFHNLHAGTYQLKNTAFLNSPVSLTLADGQLLNQNFSGFRTGDISLRFFLNTTNPDLAGIAPAQNNQPVVINPIQSVSEAVVTETTTGVTNASAVVTGLTTSNLAVGMTVSGTGVPAGATVASVDSATQIHLSANFTGTTGASTTLTFGPAPTVINNLAGNFSEGDLTNPVVTFTIAAPGDTPQTVQVTLFGTLAPQTVANFLAYVQSGAYNATVFHRVQGPNSSPSTPLRIIQGGGFTDTGLTPLTTDPDVKGEPGISNTANTLAMALSNGPNTGNSQFFFNTGDNSGSLDPQSFTVFGEVTGPGDQAVLNALAQSMFAVDAGTKFSNFADIPVYNYSGSTLPGTATAGNFAVIQNMAVTTPSAVSYTYSIVSNSNPGLVTATLGNNLTPANNSLLTLNYVAGATGSAVITVQATNQNGASVTTSFTVTVT